MLEDNVPLLTAGVTPEFGGSERGLDEGTVVFNLILEWTGTILLAVLLFGVMAFGWTQSAALSRVCDTVGALPCALLQISGLWGAIGFFTYVLGHVVYENIRETRALFSGRN